MAPTAERRDSRFAGLRVGRWAGGRGPRGSATATPCPPSPGRNVTLDLPKPQGERRKSMTTPALQEGARSELNPTTGHLGSQHRHLTSGDRVGGQSDRPPERARSQSHALVLAARPWPRTASVGGTTPLVSGPPRSLIPSADQRKTPKMSDAPMIGPA